MQRTISSLALAIFVIVLVGDTQRLMAQPARPTAAAESGVQANEPASAQVSTQEANPTAEAPKTSVEPVYSVVSPLGDSTVTMIAMAPRLDTLAGKTVGMVWNHSFKADITLPAIAESLKSAYPDIKIVPYTEIEAAVETAMGLDNFLTEEEALQIVLEDLNLDALISGNGG